MSLMKCGHCGNDRDLKEVARGYYNEESDPDSVVGFRLEWHDVAVVKQCPRCTDISLYKYDDGNYYDGDEHTLTLLYPRHRDVSVLPVAVRLEYEKTQKVKSIDSSFYVLGIRRVLEAVCSDKNATGRNLHERLKKLVDDGSMPPEFGAMSHYLRDLGNVGAHASDVTVEVSDVEAATDFVEAILEYFYISPAKLKLVADALSKRQAAEKEGDGQKEAP